MPMAWDNLPFSAFPRRGKFCIAGRSSPVFKIQEGRQVHCTDPPQARDTLIPDGPIADVRFAGVKVASMYTPLFDWAEARGRRLYAFSYDWRRSPFEAGQKLEAFLTDVLRRERESGVWTGKGAQLIVHSNGGIVACK